MENPKYYLVHIWGCVVGDASGILDDDSFNSESAGIATTPE